MNQLMNNSEGSTCVDGGIRLLRQLWDVQTLPSLQRGEGGGRGDKKGKRKQRQILYWKRITKEEVQFLEEKFATVTTLSLLPLSSIFSPSQPIFFLFFSEITAQYICQWRQQQHVAMTQIQQCGVMIG